MSRGWSSWVATRERRGVGTRPVAHPSVARNPGESHRWGERASALAPSPRGSTSPWATREFIASAIGSSVITHRGTSSIPVKLPRYVTIRGQRLVEPGPGDMVYVGPIDAGGGQGVELRLGVCVLSSDLAPLICTNLGPAGRDLGWGG